MHGLCSGLASPSLPNNRLAIGTVNGCDGAFAAQNDMADTEMDVQ